MYSVLLLNDMAESGTCVSIRGGKKKGGGGEGESLSTAASGCYFVEYKQWKLLE